MLKRLCAAVLLVTAAAVMAQTAPSDAQYEADIAKRAEGVLDVLKLDDVAKAARVKETLVAQYRSLRDLHDGRDAQLKSMAKEDKAEAEKIKGETDAAVTKLHKEFVGKLQKELTSEQVEKVKDKMTYNVVVV